MKNDDFCKCVCHKNIAIDKFEEHMSNCKDSK